MRAAALAPKLWSSWASCCRMSTSSGSIISTSAALATQHTKMWPCQQQADTPFDSESWQQRQARLPSHTSSRQLQGSIASFLMAVVLGHHCT
jgi:hypothetical protein